MAKYIIIPADVELEIGYDANDVPQTRTFTFVKHFIDRTVLRDKKWGTTADELMVAMAIRGCFQGQKPGDKVKMSPDHLQKLQDVVRNPSEGYNPAIMLQLWSFVDAVLNPETE